MDWANERYLRLFTRDTPEWVALGYDAQNLLMQIFRKVDRSGVLDLGKLGARGVAVVIHQPDRWESEIEPALKRLLDDGAIRIVGDKLVIPNFVEAQETPQSDRQRQAESRARRRDAALNGDHPTTPPARNGHVTKRDVSEQGHSASAAKSGTNGNAADAMPVTERDSSVTKRDAGVTERIRNVTRGHAVSRGVTPSLAVPIPDPDPALSRGLFPDLTPDLFPVPVNATTQIPASSYARAKPEHEPGPARVVTDHWQARYTERTGSKPTWKRERHFGQLAALLKQHSADVVNARIDVLFDAPPRFLAGSVPDFDTLVQHFDKLAEPARAIGSVVGVGAGRPLAPEELAEWSRARMEQERKEKAK